MSVDAFLQCGLVFVDAGKILLTSHNMLTQGVVKHLEVRGVIGISLLRVLGLGFPGVYARLRSGPALQARHEGALPSVSLAGTGQASDRAAQDSARSRHAMKSSE